MTSWQAAQMPPVLCARRPYGSDSQTSRTARSARTIWNSAVNRLLDRSARILFPTQVPATVASAAQMIVGACGAKAKPTSAKRHPK